MVPKDSSWETQTCLFGYLVILQGSHKDSSMKKSYFKCNISASVLISLRSSLTRSLHRRKPFDLPILSDITNELFSEVFNQ